MLICRRTRNLPQQPTCQSVEDYRRLPIIEGLMLFQWYSIEINGPMHSKKIGVVQFSCYALDHLFQQSTIEITHGLREQATDDNALRIDMSVAGVGCAHDDMLSA